MAIGFFGFVSFAWPFYSDISIIREGIAQISSQATTYSEAIDKVTSIKKSFESKLAETEKIDLMMPQKIQLAEIISATEEITSKTGVKLSKFSANQQKSQAANSEYSLINIEFNLGGTYPVLNNFLSAVEKNIRILDIREINISKDDVAGNNQLQFKVTGNTYFLKKDATTKK